MTIKIILENNHFIIVDKEAGVLTTPARFTEGDTRLCLGLELQRQQGCQIFPVHRLDFEVSGLVMYAKNAKAHRTANGWFERRQVHKSYRAWTTGQDYSHIPSQIDNPRVKIDLNLQKNFEWAGRILRGKRRSYESPQGKPSLTLASYLGLTGEGYQIWDLHPVTGRSHQLRFDLSRHGFPIVGDKLYGSSIDFGPDRLALRSYKIDFSKAHEAADFSLPSVIELP